MCVANYFNLEWLLHPVDKSPVSNGQADQV